MMRPPENKQVFDLGHYEQMILSKVIVAGIDPTAERLSLVDQVQVRELLHLFSTPGVVTIIKEVVE